MKRVICLVIAALVSTVVVAPPVAAQGENLQQLQQAWGEAQERVQTAQQYMQSEQGQEALAEAQTSLQQALDNAQQYLQSEEGQQQLDQVHQQAVERVETAQQYMQSEQGQQALEDAKVKLQEAGVQLRQARESVQGKMQEVTSKMERTALVKSGGPGLGSVGALAAPAVALLVGGAVLGYAVLRRR
jgi:uncharacterized phage infection (PIP) family protein YhgE